MSDFHLLPDPNHRGAFELFVNGVAQSWVAPDEPTHLPYEYQQRLAEALETTVLTRPAGERIRVIHLGGGALALPRYVAHVRPRTAQIVCEPNAELTEQVRRVVPLPRLSGIKVRDVDGRTGLTAMPDDYADAVIVDAFVGDRVPADLSTIEFFAETNRVLKTDGVCTMNLAGKAPFDWAKRCLAAIANHYEHLAVTADPATWKGRRFGNLVVVAAHQRLPISQLAAAATRAPLPSKLISGTEIRNWIGANPPFTDANMTMSPSGKGWI